jgi:SNF2 family DNA or RNA helicase
MNYKFRTKPYDHQKRALRRFFKQHHLAVLWEPGLGKSKFVVDAACAGHQMGKINRVLINCPLSVLGVWEDEFALHATVDYRLFTLDRRHTDIARLEPETLDVMVVNYDLGWRREKLIRAWQPDFVVADESQKIKRAGTKRSRFLRKFSSARFRAILTGTPNPRGFIDLYGQWVFLNPHTFGTRIQDFKDRYIVYGGYRGYEIRGYRHINELKRKVAQDASVRRKDQCLDLPPRTWQRIPVILEPEARSLYVKLEEDFLAYLDGGEEIEIKIALTKLGKLQQITGGFVNTDQGWRQVSSAKLNALEDLLETVYDEGDRVVVIARYLNELDAIEELGRKLKFKTYAIRGGVSKDERDSARREFQSTGDPALMVLQIQSGGLGITLHSASQAIFYSTSFALDDYIQACDRIHRIGQDRPVTYRHLVARSTVDNQIYRALREKRQIMEVIMGRNSDLTGESGVDILGSERG